MSKKIGFIGTGNMANAIINGIISREIAPPQSLYIYDVDAQKCAELSKSGLNVSPSGAELTKSCDIVFLSVKPQVYGAVLAEIAPAADTEQVFVSIAAGIPTEYVQKGLGIAARVVRVMPNTPFLLGEGASALSYKAPVTEADFAAVKQIFESSGIVSVLDEDKMNAVISVNGSSPAYVYLLAKAIIQGAEQQGIDAQTALSLFAQTLRGSAKMLLESGDTAEELIRKVSSPGGTTLQALEVLYQGGFEESVIKAMQACTKRAEELGKV
ncbi:MAG: pyrroline-5-carboxylate reductase [Oscillospiraceae bacterium]|jgi:pyrroline-5-carboxylate reductase|nr:pyrroline-5-carboxylate reductase [Oscillospiraceae bacterium]